MWTFYFAFLGYADCLMAPFLPLRHLSSLRAVEFSVVEVAGLVDREPFDSPCFIYLPEGELYLILLTLSLRALNFIILGLC